MGPWLCWVTRVRHILWEIWQTSHSGKPSFYKPAQMLEKSKTQSQKRKGIRGLGLIMDGRLGWGEKERGAQIRLAPQQRPTPRECSASLQIAAELLGEATPALQAPVIRSTQTLSSFSVRPSNLCLYRNLSISSKISNLSHGPCLFFDRDSLSTPGWPWT